MYSIRNKKKLKIFLVIMILTLFSAWCPNPSVQKPYNLFSVAPYTGIVNKVKKKNNLTQTRKC